MSFNWANQLAKTALRNAQKKIDAVLDIHEDDDSTNSARTAADAADDLDEANLVDDSGALLALEPSAAVVDSQPTSSGGRDLTGAADDVLSEAAGSECEHWTRSSWADKEQVVVDAEPNPIGDLVAGSSGGALLLHHHSPASNSSPDEAESDEQQQQQEHKRSEEHHSNKEPTPYESPPPTIIEAVEESAPSSAPFVPVDLSGSEHELHGDQQPPHQEAVVQLQKEQEHEEPEEQLQQNQQNQQVSSGDDEVSSAELASVRTASRRSSRHDDSITVASSDIEIIRNVDTWSIASSHQRGHEGRSQHLPTPKLSPESVEALRGQLRHTEQRVDELASANARLTELNTQLQKRIAALNQQQGSFKKELAGKESELADLLEEGKRMSDYSGKQSREIRRLKSQVADVDKVKAERKRLRDEKQDLEATIQTMREEHVVLKEKIKALEASVQEAKDEQTTQIRASEHHKTLHEEFARRVAELEDRIAMQEEEIVSIREEKEAYERHLSALAEDEMAGRIAGERANESALTAAIEANELRRQNEQLREQVADMQARLERSTENCREVADMLARANAPLLAEVEDLKTKLAAERQSADDADATVRELRGKLADAKRDASRLHENLSSLNERHAGEQAHLLHKLSAIEQAHAELSSKLERRETTARGERAELAARLETEQRALDEALQEAEAARAIATNLEESNGRLKAQLAEVLADLAQWQNQSQPTATAAASTVTTSLTSELLTRTSTAATAALPNANYQPSNRLPRSSSAADALSEAAGGGGMEAFASTLTTPAGNAAQMELAAVLRTRDAHLSRIAELEAALRKAEERAAAHETELKQRRAEYKALNHSYNSLLEMDGERLERIDELENDIIDLRQLLKDQLIAFAEASNAAESLAAQEEKQGRQPTAETRVDTS